MRTERARIFCPNILLSISQIIIWPLSYNSVVRVSILLNIDESLVSFVIQWTYPSRFSPLYDQCNAAMTDVIWLPNHEAIGIDLLVLKCLIASTFCDGYDVVIRRLRFIHSSPTLKF